MENLKRQLIFDIYKKVKEHPDRIALYGSGEEIRDLSYVGDQVRRIKIVSDNIKPSGDIYNIGSGEATKVNSVAEEIVKIMGLKTVINYTSEKSIRWLFLGNKYGKI